MNHEELLGRRSEILKRHIGNLVHKSNQHSLTEQETIFLKDIVKEFHRNKYEMNASRKK